MTIRKSTVKSSNEIDGGNQNVLKVNMQDIENYLFNTFEQHSS